MIFDEKWMQGLWDHLAYHTQQAMLYAQHSQPHAYHTYKIAWYCKMIEDYDA